MPTRTGVPTILKTAKRMCDLLARYSSLIKSLTPGNTSLHDALDDANTACIALSASLELVRNYGD